MTRKDTQGGRLLASIGVWQVAVLVMGPGLARNVSFLLQAAAAPGTSTPQTHCVMGRRTGKHWLSLCSCMYLSSEPAHVLKAEAC